MLNKLKTYNAPLDDTDSSILLPSAYRDNTRVGSRGTFIIEALLLLFCMIILIAAAMTIFANSLSMGSKSAVTDDAIAIAEKTAEAFAVNPVIVIGQEEWVEEPYAVICDIDANQTGAGTLYDATIRVTYESEVVYELHTNRYISGTQSVAVSPTAIDGVTR